MAQPQLLVQGYARLCFESFYAPDVVPMEIKLLFCDFYGYQLCCIAFIKQRQIKYKHTNNNIETSPKWNCTNCESDNLDIFHCINCYENDQKNASTFNIDLETCKTKYILHDPTILFDFECHIKALTASIIFGHQSCFHYLRPQNNAPYPSSNGFSPLFIAIKYDQPYIMQFLLYHLLDNKVNQMDSNRRTILFHSSVFGSTECVKKLLTYKDILIDIPDIYDRTCLFRAAFSGHLEIVKLLLSHSNKLKKERTSQSFQEYTLIDVNRRDLKHITAAFVAAQNGHADILKLLIENGADPSIKSYKGNEAISISSLRGRTDVVKYLVTVKGIDLNVQSVEGVTPLYIACQEGHGDTVS